jgi:hypothetical protein
VIGGYLAEPVKRYPSVFLPDTIWNRYPYLLPNIAVVIILLASCILGLLALQESHPRFRGGNDIGSALAAGVNNLLNGRRWSDRGERYAPVSTGEDTVELENAADASSDYPENRTPEPQSAFTNQVWLQIALTAITGFLKVSTLAIIPVFLATPSRPPMPTDYPKALKSILAINGGLGLDIQSISNVLLSQALVAIVTQIFLVPRIIAKQGPLQCFRVVLAMLVFLYCVMPFAAGSPDQLALPAILAMLWIYALLNGVGTTCSVILLGFH